MTVSVLLIVPYGIETRGLRNNNPGNIRLLIVPYGIETWMQSARKHKDCNF